MSSTNDLAPTETPSVRSHNNDHVNLRVTYLHAGNPRPPHTLGAVPCSTTIGELKSRLQTDLLEHPRPEEQRLIYQGRPLMQNDVTLKEALRLEVGANSDLGFDKLTLSGTDWATAIYYTHHIPTPTSFSPLPS